MKSKLQELLDVEGFDNVVDFLVECGDDSVVPGICINPDCNYTMGVEPDSREGWCPICKSNTIKSGLVLLGII